MKRTLGEGTKPPPNKRVKLPEYCDVEPRRDPSGKALWPASEDAIAAAQAFIRECADSGKKVLVCPDKDADGLSAGVIIHRTLRNLGLDPSLIDVHLVQKGSNIHEEVERTAMGTKSPSYIIVLDQGSRAAPPVVSDPATKCLIIDHHLSNVFPQNALVVSACHYPPVATTSLLTYEICNPLHPSIADATAYLACIGTHGDLGTTLRWTPPFPNMTDTFTVHTKKSINTAVSLLNAPRRTAKYDVITAWSALLDSTSPKTLLDNPRLQNARWEINDEVERQTHTPPQFSADGRFAVLRIRSAAQVHPVIATRWAGHLKSKKLEVVMCANYGYLPDRVNFSCRIARCAIAREVDVNVIESLQEAVKLSTDAEGLRERLGESFARGHKEASGGVVSTEVFEELMGAMRVGEKVEKKDGESSQGVAKKLKTIDKSPQKNTLGNYFAKR